MPLKKKKFDMLIQTVSKCGTPEFHQSRSNDNTDLNGPDHIKTIYIDTKLRLWEKKHYLKIEKIWEEREVEEVLALSHIAGSGFLKTTTLSISEGLAIFQGQGAGIPTRFGTYSVTVCPVTGSYRAVER